MIDALMNSFVLEEAPIFLDAELENFICMQKFSGSIKLSTGEYSLVNSARAARDGIKEKDYIGLTAYDVRDITHRKPEMTENAVYMDNQIFSRKAPLVCYQQVLLASDQWIVVEEVIKKPVFDTKNQIIALLAHGNDITRYVHPMWLFNLYESYYSTPEVVQYFLNYKKMGAMFDELPTRAELITLITMRDNQDTGSIAHRLKCSKHEIAVYQAKLREKLKVIGIEECLMCLQWGNGYEGKDAVGWD
jgi:hypothetical protein